MHFEAKKSISKNTEVLSCIPTLLGNEHYNEKDMVDKMELEISKGNTFDKEFFLDAQTFLKDTLEDCFDMGNLSNVDELQSYLQKLYQLQYLNDQILNTDTREINIMEFGENGICSTILNLIPVQDVNLPSKAFADKKRTGVLLKISKMLPEYQTIEASQQMKEKVLPLESVKVEDDSIGLWFHDIRSIQAIIKLLQNCIVFLTKETSNDIKKQMYDLQEENEAVQSYINLSIDLKLLENQMISK